MPHLCGLALGSHSRDRGEELTVEWRHLELLHRFGGVCPTSEKANKGAVSEIIKAPATQFPHKRIDAAACLSIGPHTERGMPRSLPEGRI